MVLGLIMYKAGSSILTQKNPGRVEECSNLALVAVTVPVHVLLYVLNKNSCWCVIVPVSSCGICGVYTAFVTWVFSPKDPYFCLFVCFDQK